MRQRRGERRAVVDFLALLMILSTILVLIYLYTCRDDLQPKERDCLSELRAETRKDTNFTVSEVVEYGRCIEARRDER
jgi:hypothetical protein